MKKIIAILVLTTILGLFAAAAMAAPIGNPIPSQQTATAAGSLIAKASQGYLNGFSVSNASTGGYVLIFDSSTVPADGTVTPRFCYALPADTTISATWINNPVPFANGIVLVFSSGANCYTKTISNTAFFSVQVQ